MLFFFFSIFLPVIWWIKMNNILKAKTWKKHTNLYYWPYPTRWPTRRCPDHNRPTGITSGDGIFLNGESNLREDVFREIYPVLLVLRPFFCLSLSFLCPPRRTSPLHHHHPPICSIKRYDTIRCDSGYLTCSKKLTGSQLSLPHGTNKKLECETKNKMMSIIGPVRSSPVIVRQSSR